MTMCRKVFNVWPKPTLLPVWPRDARRVATPAGRQYKVPQTQGGRSLCPGGSCGNRPFATWAGAEEGIAIATAGPKALRSEVLSVGEESHSIHVTNT